MSDIADEEPPPRKRGCFKSCFLGLLGLGFVLALVVWGGRAAVRRQGERQLQIVTRQLDAEEPGWKLDALEAARAGKFPAPEKNSAPAILEIGEQIPNDLYEWQKDAAWTGEPPSNHLRPEKEVAAMRRVDEPTRAVRAAALRLLDLTPGGFKIEHKENPFATLYPHLDKVRRLAGLMQFDALLAAADGKPELAVRAAHVQLNVARSVGEEPSLISQLVRLACAKMSCNSTLQAMAWGEPKAGLAELQAALWAEAEADKLLSGLIGERAGIHKFFDALETGRLSPDEMFKMMDGNTPTFWQAGGMRLYKAMLPGDHAESLRVFGEYIAAAKLPPHEQIAALRRVKLPPRPPESFRYLITSLVTPAVDRIAEATVRTRADLYSAAAAIAVERFRQKNGRWPKSLAEIPKDILPAVPTDPYDGQPLKFLAMPDGVAVYSVGPEVTERNRNQKRTGPVNGDGQGWRLYDPDKRRLPPKPPDPDAENGP